MSLLAYMKNKLLKCLLGQKPVRVNWYRLDNAAKIFPVIKRSRHGAVFRLAVTLREPVDPEILQQAVDKTLRRLPFFAVRLRHGLFWYYLESLNRRALVEEDVHDPMRPWSRNEDKSFLFRVRYSNRRIAVEIFHALTDGYGASVFLRTLTGAYLGLQGVAYEPGHGVLDLDQPATESEMEDAYNRFSNFRVVRRPHETKAFRLQGTIRAGHHPNIICGTLPTDRIAEVAKSYHISITELLVGVYLYELYLIQQQGRFDTLSPVRISVPINVRRFYPTDSLRNFALYANPGIEPAFGTYTMEEIFGLVHHYMRYTINEKYLNALMCANVGPERNMLLRLSPLPLKNLVMRLAYKLTGDSRFTSTLSNLGVLDLPEGLKPHVERFEFLVGPSHYNPVNCAVTSYENQMVINFTGTMDETDPQRYFFRRLVQLGIPVRIESNFDYGE